mgnify:FL=1
MNKKDKKIKIGIVVLSVLLVISIVALICIMIKGCSAHSTTTTKNPGNIIALRSEANKSFQVTNLLPGDRETQNYRIEVSVKEDVTVHFRADIREGYEKLAEVLMIRVSLPYEDGLLYDGLMRDMPESVSYSLGKDSADKGELDYEITAYLDTSVGNEYTNKDLVADFRWWIEKDSSHGGTIDDEGGRCCPWCFGICPWCWILPLIIVAVIIVILIVWILLRRKNNKSKETEAKLSE